MTAYDIEMNAKRRQDVLVQEAEHSRLVREARKAAASDRDAAPTASGFVAWAIERADRRMRHATARRAA